MKKALGILSVVASVLTISSCSTDFEIAAPYKDVAVVNGLVDASDSVNYIRIQKVFMNEDYSANQMAQVPDSSFFNDLTVTLKEMNANGTVVSRTTLTKVDMADDGYIKEDGDFFTSPNTGYKFTKKLNTAYTYQLVIKNNETGWADSAETIILDAGAIALPELSRADYRLIFYDPNAPTASFRIIATFPQNAAFIQGVLRIHWLDYNTSTTKYTDRYADWVFHTSTSTTDQVQLSHAEFYNFLVNAMGAAPENTVRYFNRPDLYMYIGTQQVQDYRNYQQSGGLTSDQAHPSYSNFATDQTIGIFTSKAVRADTSLQFSNVTKDRILNNPLLKDLKILEVR